MTTNVPAVNKISKLKEILSADSVKNQIQNAMADSAPLFIASLIDVVGSDNRLQECEPAAIVREALKAATLKLPINRGLGFAWLIPRRQGKGQNSKMVPSMQLGYKGLLQLAQRTGSYRYINAGPVYEGELKSQSKLTGEIDLSGEKKNDKIVGYFAYIETLSGFKKTVYGTVEDIEKHAKKFSDSFGKNFSAWTTNFDAMAIKTMLTALLSKYGVMSVEMITAFENESRENDMINGQQHTGETIDIDPEPEQIEDNTEKFRKCPDRDDAKMKESYCKNDCKKIDGCPSWSDAEEAEIIEDDSEIKAGF